MVPVSLFPNAVQFRDHQRSTGQENHVRTGFVFLGSLALVDSLAKNRATNIHRSPRVDCDAKQYGK